MSDKRVDLAQELHDGIAQDLVGLGFSIDAVIASCTDLESKEELRRIRFAVSESIEKVRRELHALRKPSTPVADLQEQDLGHEMERVFSEILRNVQEHSMATRLNIHISDNGIGGAQSKEGRFGLQGLQERISKLNGEITIVSNELGTKIGIEIPLDG